MTNPRSLSPETGAVVARGCYRARPGAARPAVQILLVFLICAAVEALGVLVAWV